MAHSEERTDGEFETEDDLHEDPEVSTPQSAPPCEVITDVFYQEGPLLWVVR